MTAAWGLFSASPATRSQGPPSGDARLEDLRGFNTQSGGESLIIHNLSSDGSRVFFETPEALASKDVNGANGHLRVAAGRRSPTSPRLISSGLAPFPTNPEVPLLTFEEPNVMFGVSPSGGDVIFRTFERLVSAAGSGGSPAIYDARVNGGFAEQLQGQCQKQACAQLQTPPPSLTDPQSDRFRGAGNVRHRRHRCHQGKKSKHKHRKCHHRHRKGSGK